jgi:hypothetical protein
VNYGRKKIYKIYPKAEQISKLNDFQDKVIGCKDKAFNFRNGRFCLAVFFLFTSTSG